MANEYGAWLGFTPESISEAADSWLPPDVWDIAASMSLLESESTDADATTLEPDVESVPRVDDT